MVVGVPLRQYNGRPLGFITANELHVPASRSGDPRHVFLDLQSADVCHSFWVPRLAGKTDLIPGQTNHMWFQTNEHGNRLSGSAPSIAARSTPGCCSRVIVDAPEDFEHWLTQQKETGTR